MRIRRGVSSRVLPCGCLAGIYETYSDEIVVIVDARHAKCANPAHADGSILPTRLIRNNPPATPSANR